MDTCSVVLRFNRATPQPVLSKQAISQCCCSPDSVESPLRAGNDHLLADSFSQPLTPSRLAGATQAFLMAADQPTSHNAFACSAGIPGLPPSAAASSTAPPSAAHGDCPVCSLPATEYCRCCDDNFCFSHLYRCPDCQLSFCGRCFDLHNAELHWSDSDTATEMAHCSRGVFAHANDATRSGIASYIGIARRAREYFLSSPFGAHPPTATRVGRHAASSIRTRNAPVGRRISTIQLLASFIHGLFVTPTAALQASL
jgi:hypothetical protein